MNNTLQIAASCRITDTGIWLNGQDLHLMPEANTDWLTSIYRTINMAYPKFFKMDKLCKAGTLAAEMVMRDLQLQPETLKPNWSVVCLSRSGSLQTDSEYQQTIGTEYFPSPAVFVYTLANIVTGEIAIRHKLQGESTMLIAEHFSAQQLTDAAYDAFADEPAIDYALCGWVEYFDGHADTLMLAVARQHANSPELTVQAVDKLYTSAICPIR